MSSATASLTRDSRVAGFKEIIARTPAVKRGNIHAQGGNGCTRDSWGSLLAYPWALIVIGRAMFALGGVLTLLGLRVGRAGRRIARVFERIGTEAPDVTAGFPWWLRMWIPETAEGWLGVALLLCIGAYFVYMGKWAKKFQA